MINLANYFAVNAYMPKRVIFDSQNLKLSISKLTADQSLPMQSMHCVKYQLGFHFALTFCSYNQVSLSYFSLNFSLKSQPKQGVLGLKIGFVHFRKNLIKL